MTAIAKHSKGYLPLEIIIPSKLKMITDSILSVVQEANPSYVLALPVKTQYYDKKLVTFGVDNNLSLVEFIKAITRKP